MTVFPSHVGCLSNILQQNYMEFPNEYIKAKFQRPLSLSFGVKKKIFFLNMYGVHPYKENKICLHKQKMG